MFDFSDTLLKALYFGRTTLGGVALFLRLLLMLIGFESAEVNSVDAGNAAGTYDFSSASIHVYVNCGLCF